MIISCIQTLVMCNKNFIIVLIMICIEIPAFVFASDAKKKEIKPNQYSGKMTLYRGWGVSYNFLPCGWDSCEGLPTENSIPVHATMHEMGLEIYWPIGRPSKTTARWAGWSTGIGWSYGEGEKKDLYLYRYPASNYFSATSVDISGGILTMTFLKNVFLSFECRCKFGLGKTDFKMNINADGANVTYEAKENGFFGMALMNRTGLKIGKSILCLEGGLKNRQYSGGSSSEINLSGFFVGLELLFLQEREYYF